VPAPKPLTEFCLTRKQEAFLYSGTGVPLLKRGMETLAGFACRCPGKFPDACRMHPENHEDATSPEGMGCTLLRVFFHACCAVLRVYEEGQLVLKCLTSSTELGHFIARARYLSHFDRREDFFELPGT